MGAFINHMIQETSTFTIQEITTNLVIATLLGVLIFISYYFTHLGGIYSKKFNVSLVCLSVLTATVITVIGSNVALSLGMVGALSIIRFRTAIKDSRDTTYIFWAIIVGMCCGVGDYIVACIGSAIVFVILLILGRVKNDNRMLLIIRGAMNMERRIEVVVFEYFEAGAMLRVKNTTHDSIELIFELSRKRYNKASQKEKSIIQLLYGLGDINYVNVIAQSDEISG